MQTTKTFEVELTPEQLAEEFWGMDVTQQAKFFNILTWTKPRTFTLNGEVLPCPGEREDTTSSFSVGGQPFYFNTGVERDQVFNAILRILTDAKNS